MGKSTQHGVRELGLSARLWVNLSKLAYRSEPAFQPVQRGSSNSVSQSAQKYVYMRPMLVSHGLM